jgi:UDP-glucose 4-epimerase
MSKSGLCLVLGANGFVGSHLVDELANAGYLVRAFDRFSQPARFHKSDKVEIVPGDIFDDMAILQALEGVDYVFHSFSATTPFTSDSDPYSDITLNLLRNVQLFEKSIEAGVKKLLFMSSGGAVYGTVAERKQATEDDAPLPVSPYGIGKLGAEYYLAYFNRKYNLDYVAYRLTNPYGPRQAAKNNQGVIPTFIDKIKAGQELVLLGDGKASRDYIYVRDATKMVVASFAKHTKHTVYNIGSGRQTNLNEIIAAIETVTTVKAKITYGEYPKTFLQKTRVSIARYVNEFGPAPDTSLEEGLRKAITNL